MRGAKWKCIVIGLCFFVSKSLFAQSLTFSRNARTFDTQQSSLVVKGMGYACLSIFNIPDGMPCNPAHVALNEAPRFGTEVLISNGYSSLSDVRKLLDGEVDQDLINKLFEEQNILQIEANTEINFQSNLFNARYTPITVKGLVVVRNEANPDVELSAFEESGFLFQSGAEIFHDVYLGAQVRFVERKFIKQQFLLLDLATQDGKDQIKPKLQRATYIEPGLTWVIAETWRPRISLFLANAGFVSEQFDELDIPKELQLGFGISPPVQWGKLDVSLDYKSLNYDESVGEKIHLGAMYSFGAMYLTGGIDANGISGGIFYGLEQVNAGVLYSTTKGVNSDEDFYTQTVYVQLGWQI